MVATLLRFVGIDLRRMAREAAVTLALIVVGAFAAILACAIGFAALFLWLDELLGTFAALGILGGVLVLLAIVLFAVAFRRAPRKPGVYAEDALRAAAGSAPASVATLARTADEAAKGIAEIVGNGSRQQIIGTIAVAALIGWVLGRRS
jgi:hypothetical protein